MKKSPSHIRVLFATRQDRDEKVYRSDGNTSKFVINVLLLHQYGAGKDADPTHPLLYHPETIWGRSPKSH